MPASYGKLRPVKRCGFAEVSTCRPRPFNRSATSELCRGLDATVREQVVQIDLRSAGIENLAGYPDSFRGVPAVPELFFNDQRLVPALAKHRLGNDRQDCRLGRSTSRGRHFVSARHLRVQR